MEEISVVEESGGLRVTSAAWEITHLAAAGGAWASIVLKNGSGRNLLRAPAASALRFVRADPSCAAGAFSTFSERNEKSPRLRVESGAGGPVIVAEGTYRDEEGRPLPVGYRRRTEYHERGLSWTTLEIMSEAGCDGVVEVRALELPLRAGITECCVRLHPTQGGGADLLCAQCRFDLGSPPATCALPQGGRETAAFLSRYTPLQILCSARDPEAEGIELFPAAELAEWDCAFKPDLGLGLYSVARNEAGIDVLLSPYCLAFRRMGIRVQGNVKLRLGVALSLQPGVCIPQAPVSRIVRGLPCAEEELARLARAGVRLLRFEDRFREGAPFWRNGAYPPYAEAGMSELQGVIETAHRHEMKIVPYVSLKELHPETPAFAEHARQWMRTAAPSLDIVHNWVGSGESGACMCLKSGWSGYCKEYVDKILSGLAWDGLELDLATAHACCHPEHARGPFHSDVDNVLEFLKYCRQRLGKQGVLVLRTEGGDSFLARNFADVVTARSEPRP
ncbi:MAG: DUF6259 domain-containing protein [Planctomycetota bacterium]